jgi:hypothetical protein
MAICLDCIKAATGGGAPPKCDGVKFIYTLSSDYSTGSVPADAVVNANSPIGYDYVFNVGKDLYTITYTGSSWKILDERGSTIASSSATGAGNNTCPPNSGWSLSNNRLFQGISLDITYVPQPSADCVNTNGTFDTNATGWTLAGTMTYSASFTGSLRKLGINLGSATQSGILTIGDTYKITLSYRASLDRACAKVEADAAYIRIYAGTKVYESDLTSTLGLPNGFAQIVVELTCEGGTNFKVDVFDGFECWDDSGKGIYIDDICITRVSGGTPIAVLSYSEIAEVPLTLNGVDYNTKLDQYQNCLAQKGTTFYNKVIGGVNCDYRELTKLKLITELLAQKDKDRALDCIYDRKDVPTATYETIPCSVSGLTINTANPLTINGDYTPFETFDLQVVNPSTSVVVESKKIIDVTFNSGTSQSTILIDSAFSTTYTGYDICLVQNAESTTTYLETFINFANRFCADCSASTSTTSTTGSSGSTSGSTGGVGLDVATSDLKSETGIDITTEFNQKITI